VGGDLACRLSLAPARPYEDGGWYPPPLVNLISSAASCAKLIGLEADRVIAAMSLALLSGSFPAALKHDRESPLRGTREAFAARGAVQAALLAQAGAAGFADPLGGPGGFFDVYGGGYRRDVLFYRLGDRYLGTDVSFKPWPACRGTHAYIEAALELRQLANPADVQEVSVGIGPIQQMLRARPPTLARTDFQRSKPSSASRTRCPSPSPREQSLSARSMPRTSATNASGTSRPKCTRQRWRAGVGSTPPAGDCRSVSRMARGTRSK
jgi:hypothetical protein